ncbi:MAG: ABC transporter substrate-binding protein [Haloarculaceae archaeon]
MTSKDTSRVSRRTLIRGAGAAAVTGLAGCSSGDGGSGDGGAGDGGSGDGSGDGGATKTTAQSGSGLDSVTVGYATSLSGPFAVFGETAVHGAELAKQDLEAEFDIDVEIATADTEVNPSTGLERMKRLVVEDGVDVTMGGVSSSVALKMGTWASDNGVPYMATGAHSDLLTGEQCAENMYRVTCSNSMLANTIGQQMAETADTWFLIYSDYTWGQTAQKAVTNILEENGKTVVGKTAAPFPNDDYTQYLNEASSSDAVGLGLLVAGLDMRLATKQLRNKGIQEDMKLAMHQIEDVVYWGLSKEATEVMDVGGQVWGPGSPNGGEFAKRVAETGETDPFVRHYLGYAGVDQMVRAAVRADSKDAADIRAELEGHTVDSPINDIKGGEMHWRAEDHQLVQPTYAVKPRAVDEMSDDPYKQWFETTETFAGADVARSPSETGCNL